ncbi:hypothetical protein H0H92_001493 [Tricholoma furcatifolium]|nr:hypothetical protein H0H92_001493 [Tricholoma furcatifolium]
MTAVLPPGDPLRKDRRMSLDDNEISYSPPSATDWRAKYNEVAEMLAETRAELDDFHHASKELEAELENELQRTEKAQQDLRIKAIHAETERDEWKNKFMSLQTNHNATTASLQRELDKLRQDYQQAKVQLRDLEMGNDDLERNERAVSSSLADMEAKYSRALEEKILLEHELLEKASLEEDTQRLRDELRDQVTGLTLAAQSKTPSTDTPSDSQTQFPQISTSQDDLLNTAPPPDLELDDISLTSDALPSDNSTLQSTPKGTLSKNSQTTLMQRGSFDASKSKIGTPSHPRVTRSTTLPSLYTSSPRTPVTRALPRANNIVPSTTSVASTTSKSKGVQMVSEMRARVRNLEQKIHTRVPRLRMGSMTAKTNPNSVTYAGPTSNTTSSASSFSNRASAARMGWESFTHRRSVESTRSNNSGSEKNQKEHAGDSSGWVLIMEDSPPPSKEREKRRVTNSSPSRVPTSFRPGPTTALTSPTLNSHQPNSGVRRPQSRLSAGSLSTTTTSSIPTPTSRPATPTFLPIPSNGLYTTPGLKRSIGPGGPTSSMQSKRSSLGASTAISPVDNGRDRIVTMPPRPASGTPLSSAKFDEGKALPQLPGLHANITMRDKTKATTPPALAQSRIGRPSGGVSGRRSTDGMPAGSRLRSGSTSGT